jgi:serine/threonine-protein kinase
MVTVPLVEGLKQQAASARLKRAGLDAKVVNVAAQEPVGTVIAQSPKAGARVHSGSAVQINVAGAAAGSTDTTPTTGTATVPNVVGTRDTEAVARIKMAGFRAQSTAVSSDQPTGTVLTQSPAGGTVARRGTTVKLTVSGGARVRVVPNVVGRTEADASRSLRAAGFVARPVDRAVTDPTQDGRVVEQDPGAGTRVQGSTEVLIFVGRLTP